MRTKIMRAYKLRISRQINKDAQTQIGPPNDLLYGDTLGLDWSNSLYTAHQVYYSNVLITNRYMNLT